MTYEFKAFVVVILWIIFIAVAILLFDSHDKKDEQKIVVTPTCVELDNSGYDGLISCIDQDGEIVRPGEN